MIKKDRCIFNQMAKKKLKREDIIGATIMEVLPYHDGAEIRLDTGVNLDAAIGNLNEPEHPASIQAIYKELEKAGSIIPKSKLKKIYSSLIGQEFLFNGVQCAVRKVKDYDLGEVYIEQTEGRIGDLMVGSLLKRTVNIYSLEDIAKG